jgi:NAD-dependent deacetylase
MVQVNASYQDAAAMILSARHLVVFTGAGISTSSGIPDFRSSNQGLWNKENPMEVASLSVFMQHPGRFYDWYQPLLQAATKALPNPAHVVIAELEKMGILKSIITQNIDGLHQDAGSQNVIELHGTMRAYDCLHCGMNAQDPSIITEQVLAGEYPRCAACHAVLKPAIILFEESLPTAAWEAALSEMISADVLLVAGSSLEVVPASTLPWTAVHRGCNLIMINLSATEIDDAAKVLIQEDVAKVLPEILGLIQSSRRIP